MTSLCRLVVGISGASCTGKTTLTKLLKATFPWSSVVHQDGYYHPNDPKFHVYLPDVKHFNWDIKSAVDFPKMEGDLERLLLPTREHTGETSNDSFKLRQVEEKLLHCPNGDFVRRNGPPANEVDFLVSRFSKIPLIILEGHILFSHPAFYRLCDSKYFLTLDQEELFARRQRRVYDPPNPPGYLEKYVWPAYVSRLDEVQALSGIKYYDAKTVPLLDMYHEMKQSITMQMAKMISPTPKVEDSGGDDTRVKVDRHG